ncbi:MAG: iron ABC transporter permease, partial [Phycisphaerales bacterium]|nr:iron ABC transporter permease [Phycisphaerales bacterium]
FLLYPIFLTVRGGFASNVATGEGWTLAHLRALGADRLALVGLGNALLIAMATTVLSLLFAVPLAIIGARCRFRGKAFWNAAVLVPLILPPFVGAIGFRAIMGRQGTLNTLLGTDWDILGHARFWGVVLVEALHLYPIIYLNATAALANLDPALDEAAENLGASAWTRFRRITLPLIRPGLFAGATIVFIWSFTELGTPLMFEMHDVTPVQIYHGLKEVQTSPRPYVLTVVMLGVAVLLYLVGRLTFAGRSYEMYSKASRASAEKPLGRAGTIGATALFAFVGFLAVIPHLGVLLTSVTQPGQWYRTILPSAYTTSNYVEALTDEQAFGSIVNSLQLAIGAVIVDVLLGLVIAYMIVRTKAKGRGLLDALCMLPLAVPGLVMAFGYVSMTLRWPFGGDMPSGLASVLRVILPDGVVHALSAPPLAGTLEVFGTDPNPFPLLVIAYAIRRLPYIVRSSIAGLEQTSGELEEAAINLGASRLLAIRRVIVPLIAANLIAGSLLVFSFSMLEVSD